MSIINIKITKYLQFLEGFPNPNITKEFLEMCKEMSTKNQMIYTQRISYNLPNASSLNVTFSASGVSLSQILKRL